MTRERSGIGERATRWVGASTRLLELGRQGNGGNERAHLRLRVHSRIVNAC